MKVRLAITPGAEEGVGPRLLVRALMKLGLGDDSITWCGDRRSLVEACEVEGLLCSMVDGPSSRRAMVGGRVLVTYAEHVAFESSLERQACFLDEATRLARADEVDALVTGPIEKAALSYVCDGPFVGQTEYFAHHLGGGKSLMAFGGGPFVLTLLTTHLPLVKVPAAISEKSLLEHLLKVANYVSPLLEKFPNDLLIAVLGLNPHAGEHGLLGDEEDMMIKPALCKAQELGLKVLGPLAADGFFAHCHRMNPMPDVVVALYHDQGLSAYKLMAQNQAVNITLGLKVPRLSPAHGTAKDNLNKACDLSTYKALDLALRLARYQMRVSSPERHKGKSSAT